MTIKKRNGKFLEIENPVENGCFISSIKTKDVIRYKCEKCGNDGSREAGLFEKPLVEFSFWCGKCRTLRARLENQEEINKKREETNLLRYGIKNTGSMNKNSSFKDPLVIEKIKKTNLLKYGVEFPLQNVSVVEKRRENNLKKTGYAHHMKNPENNKNSPFSREDVKKKILEKNYDNLKCFKEATPLFTKEEYTGSKKTDYKFKCNKCGNEFFSRIENGHKIRCLVCYPHIQGTSNKEKEIADFIKKHYHKEVIENYKDGLELDVYIPELNTAFEFDGLWWHSEKYKDKNYHIDKMNYFKEKGITVINIFEDEWDNKQAIVKSMILNKITNGNKKIYARNCELREMKECKEFLDNNHIQGNCPASIKYGLFHNNELVSVMTFGKSRFDSKYEWELIRSATKQGIVVVGGASKLFNHFLKNNTGSIVSYCDLRYFTGGIYDKLGFKFSHISKPAYFYVKGDKRYSRIMFQKHKLKDVLNKFDGNLTESENMNLNGYYKVYDCGNKVFTISR